jgi:C4-dicarboxylate-specific signal transduction histidine kinase
MRSGWRNASLRVKLIAGVVSVIVALTLIYSLLVLERVKEAHDAEIEKRGRAIAEQLGSLAEFPLRTGDAAALDMMARDALLREDIQAVAILSLEDKKVVKVESKTRPTGRTREFSYSIRIKPKAFANEIDILQGIPSEKAERTLGEVKVTLSLAGTDRMISEIRTAMILTALVLVSLAILISVYMARRITDPLLALAKEVEKIGKGKFDVRIEDMGRGEIGVLADQFNRMTENLKRSLDQMIQQEKMASLGRMAAGITHEIGGPLNSILLDTKLLLDHMSEGAERDTAEAIVFQAKRMKEIVNHLLDYAHTPPTEMQAVDINQALEEALRVLAHPLKKSALKIKREIPEDLPKARAIRNTCVQVFVNLISNAIEATGEDGELRIEARAEEERSSLLMTFTDNGPGIPEEFLTSIFDPFFTTKEQGKGTGLGLAICQQIMQSFGGDIRAENAKGGGTRFILKFQCVTINGLV